MKPHPYACSIANLLKDAGFLDVQLEYKVKKALWKRRGRAFIPFDISYHAGAQREYVECKAGRASEEDVAKFIADLRLCNLPIRAGYLVAQKGIQPLGIDYARHEGQRVYTAHVGKRLPITERLYAQFAAFPKSLLGIAPLPAEFKVI